MQNNWMACDGNGKVGMATRVPISRRGVIQGSVAAALAAWLGRSALHNVAFADPTKTAQRDILVTVFLRGGADGLNLVVPYGEDEYHRLRPTIGLKKTDLLDLNGFFGLHPAFKALYSQYKEGRLAIVHAVGSQDKTRSHFEAMATMERGMADENGSETSGWLARYLNVVPALSPSPLRAVAFGTILPDMLRGASNVSTLQSLNDFRLSLPDNSSLPATLASLYRTGDDAVTASGRETLAVLKVMEQIDPANYQPANGAKYPEGELGTGLRQVACLIRANIGLEVACLDKGGWDTHVAQGTTEGLLPGLIEDVGDSLAAFAQDLGADGLRRVTVLVMTEFGRRAEENTGLGTDHGRASVAFLLGGHVNGGKVYGKWPTLKKAQLEDGLDLRVTTDYRHILGELIVRRLRGDSHHPAIFPGSRTGLEWLNLFA